jgi:hypothetical protein
MAAISQAQKKVHPKMPTVKDEGLPFYKALY